MAIMAANNPFDSRLCLWGIEGQRRRHDHRHRPGLVWLKNANCFVEVSWYDSLNSKTPGLASGQCGLTDKSTAGQWRDAQQNRVADQSTQFDGVYKRPGQLLDERNQRIRRKQRLGRQPVRRHVYATSKAVTRDMSLLPVRAIIK